MDVSIVCVGKLKEQYWRDACDEYAKRLSAFCRFSIVETAEARLPKSPSSAEIAKALEEEGERILQKLPSDGYVIAMCVEGDIMSSEQLAANIARAAVSGRSSVAVVIGGSHGLSPAVKARAHSRVSIGRMTFPHQLARVMMCEQLYRAFSINGGGQYHK